MEKRRCLKGLKVLMLTLAMLMMPMFAQKVNAEEQVKIELTYIYVNEEGENSLYIDTQYVPEGTTWGTFFGSYQRCNTNGTITNANADNDWTVAVQNIRYSSTDYYYSNVIQNFNEYTDCALVTFYGMPDTYEHGYYAYQYYEDGEMKDSGTGWDILLPKAYAYGSDEEIAYVRRNAYIHSYMADLFNKPGATVTITAPWDPADYEGRWPGYLFDIQVNTSGTPQNFQDIKPGAYYEAPVAWAVEKGITSGTSATTFEPDSFCTRGQIVTFLWRAAGSPEPQSMSHSFTDIESSAYYYKAVLWAVEKGITSGTSATTFSPSETCTRAQAVTFLYRYAGKPSMESASNPFEDVSSGTYYYDPVLWAVEKGITSGTSATTFAPVDNCTRGQIVTFLYRQAK